MKIFIRYKTRKAALTMGRRMKRSFGIATIGQRFAKGWYYAEGEEGESLANFANEMNGVVWVDWSSQGEENIHRHGEP